MFPDRSGRKSEGWDQGQNPRRMSELKKQRDDLFERERLKQIKDDGEGSDIWESHDIGWGSSLKPLIIIQAR
jgi:hypothetical protein